MDRSGLRIKLLKQQALAGGIVLLFDGESEALTHPCLARAWAKRGAGLRVHTSKATLAALAEPSHWLVPEWMAKYAPALNGIERQWKHLKAHHPAHRTFAGTSGLQATIKREIQAMNDARQPLPLAKLRISA